MNAPPTILLTGKNGQIGWELQRTMAPLGNVIALGRQEMDLADPDSIRHGIREIRPDIIVNAAAYTAVDKAESEPQLVMAINGVAPGIMAEEAKRIGATIVHYSTDYVFDGTKGTPYTEDDAPNPINIYGKSKLAGEEAIKAAGVPHLIFRTSWVYGARGRNFLLTVLRCARRSEAMRIVDDQYGAPTWCRTVGEATAQILSQRFPAVDRNAPIDVGAGKIYHMSCEQRTSWYEFATEIFRRTAIFESNRRCVLKAVQSEDYPGVALRPKNSVLSTARVRKAFNLIMPNWVETLELCLQDMGYGR